MELILVNNDPSRTLLVTAEGLQYEINTPRDRTDAMTTIIRSDSVLSTGHLKTEIGKVERKSQGTRLQLCHGTTNHELLLYPLETPDIEK